MMWQANRRALMSYAGDVSCLECWDALRSASDSQLVDVRTFPEWNFVGLPDLREAGKDLVTVEWQQFPSMQVNADFVKAVNAAMDTVGAGKSSAIYCLCRSGVRSMAAASALTDAGYTNVFNVLGGFEGDRDERGRRATISGWKFDQLPWVQG
jgi:rhodanese-related sulfurtransferase